MLIFYVRSRHPLLNIHAIIAQHIVIKPKTASDAEDEAAFRTGCITLIVIFLIAFFIIAISSS